MHLSVLWNSFQNKNKIRYAKELEIKMYIFTHEEMKGLQVDVLLLDGRKKLPLFSTTTTVILGCVTFAMTRMTQKTTFCHASSISLFGNRVLVLKTVE